MHELVKQHDESLSSKKQRTAASIMWHLPLPHVFYVHSWSEQSLFRFPAYLMSRKEVFKTKKLSWIALDVKNSSGQE